MPNADPRSWFDKAIGVCLGILVGAAALYIAVHLVLAVADALLVILGVGAFVALGVALVRYRRNGW
jgi:uncharacterized membrane protein YccC